MLCALVCGHRSASSYHCQTHATFDTCVPSEWSYEGECLAHGILWGPQHVAPTNSKLAVTWASTTLVIIHDITAWRRKPGC